MNAVTLVYVYNNKHGKRHETRCNSLTTASEIRCFKLLYVGGTSLEAMLFYFVMLSLNLNIEDDSLYVLFSSKVKKIAKAGKLRQKLY